MILRVTPKTGMGNDNGWITQLKWQIALLLLTLSHSSPSLAATPTQTTKLLVLQSLQMQEFVQILAVRATAELERQLAEDQVLKEKAPPRQVTFLSQQPPQVIGQGTKLSVNGRTLTVAWKQWQVGGSVRTGISDVGVQQALGIELLSTGDFTRQPIQWFSASPTTPLVLPSQLSGAYRYLDITDFARQVGWQLQVEGDTLRLSSIPARVQNIRMGVQPWGFRIVIDLDRPTPWQISDRRTEGSINLEALADPSLVERFTPPPTEQVQGQEDTAPISVGAQEDEPVIRLENGQNQTTIRVDIPQGQRMQVFSVPNPNRLVIDLRPDAMVEKNILWAPGIQWHQRYVNLGDERFPVVWLEINPKTSGTLFRPIWSNPSTQVGTAPLIQTAQLWQAVAAINAGFFNRNNQLPLGAIRRDGRWFSGPILNRGAIAWTDQGQFQVGRLSLSETLVTSGGARFPILFLNSGYVQGGISRYTPEWGATYTPLVDNEVIFVVQNDQIMTQLPGGVAGTETFAIPTNGYLLTLRSNGTTFDTNLLGIGEGLRIESSTVPAEFNSYPHILGAGPLLVQNGQIVLDAKAEQFSDAFIQQAAVRSSIGTTAPGTLIMAAVHYGTGGRGVTLMEMGQLMQQLGAVDALNFDGGSSTGLFLGGHLLDRSPDTAARVHNALGLFRSTLP
ncbi:MULTISPECIES: phosphodiester glycosidase family protein [unclassified Coleofasciculus]|uniref:phosphodiester glycosidase family protein n=1 Tax=unclassified Coleofasciculus TaxID=2692782 RepID=UPI00187F93AD|nr:MULTISPECIES: phosphodiester glycosidase family protein [unclassified Coleofasciculus]MBE9125705.1 phosphodiester glycosidase family protein [Coleofasciculus sp. LEGE 07081]MBE9148315.1 phosphodiester glycosidase family protein [Coleofasciculus sp. LEGE 07092]